MARKTPKSWQHIQNQASKQTSGEKAQMPHSPAPDELKVGRRMSGKAKAIVLGASAVGGGYAMVHHHRKSKVNKGLPMPRGPMPYRRFAHLEGEVIGESYSKIPMSGRKKALIIAGGGSAAVGTGAGVRRLRKKPEEKLVAKSLKLSAVSPQRPSIKRIKAVGMR